MSEKKHSHEQSKRAREELAKILRKSGVDGRTADKVANDTAERVDRERQGK